jgi:hypothetical protein
MLANWLTQALLTPQRDETLFIANTFIICYGCTLYKCGFYAMAVLLPVKDPPPSTPCIGDWVGPEAVWMFWRREKSCTCCHIYSRLSCLWHSQCINYAVQGAGFGLC